MSGGCTPRCEDTCAKVLDCGLGATRVSRDECVLMCQRQGDLYGNWDDDAKLSALREHRRCIAASSCEEIAEGVCYDDDLFVY